MKKHCIIVLLLIPIMPLLSQEQSVYKYKDLNAEGRRDHGELHGTPGSPLLIARISITEPMFVLEFAPAEHFIFSTRIRIWPTFHEKNNEGQNIYHPSLNPRITLEPRYFFTQSHRRLTGRRTDYYSGWYFGLPFTLDIPELDFTMGSLLGFQCTFGKRWYWNVGLGPGVTYKDAAFKMAPGWTAGFGIILN